MAVLWRTVTVAVYGGWDGEGAAAAAEDRARATVDRCERWRRGGRVRMERLTCRRYLWSDMGDGLYVTGCSIDRGAGSC